MMLDKETNTSALMCVWKLVAVIECKVQQYDDYQILKSSLNERFLSDHPFLDALTLLFEFLLQSKFIFVKSLLIIKLLVLA